MIQVLPQMPQPGHVYKMSGPPLLTLEIRLNRAIKFALC